MTDMPMPSVRRKDMYVNFAVTISTVSELMHAERLPTLLGLLITLVLIAQAVFPRSRRDSRQANSQRSN